jgi:hypothetical protein
MPIRQGNHEPIKQDCLMSLSKANLLTLWGFCTLYIGLMSTLIAINVPVISGFRIPVLGPQRNSIGWSNGDVNWQNDQSGRK